MSHPAQYHQGGFTPNQPNAYQNSGFPPNVAGGVNNNPAYAQNRAGAPPQINSNTRDSIPQHQQYMMQQQQQQQLLQQRQQQLLQQQAQLQQQKAVQQYGAPSQQYTQRDNQRGGYTPQYNAANPAAPQQAVQNQAYPQSQFVPPAAGSSDMAIAKTEVSSDFAQVLSVLDKLPPPEDDDMKELEHVIRKDAENEKEQAFTNYRYQKHLKRKRVEIEYYNQVLSLRQTKPGSIFDGGYSGYGNGWTGNQFRIVYPKERKRNKRQSRELMLTAAQLEQAAETVESLVPLRLDLEIDKYRLHDTFTWNINEKTISVAQFAENLIEDFHLPQHLTSNITSSINEQISDFHPHAFVDISEPKYASSKAYRDEDMRITIKLDITVGQHNLVDQFEWDMNCPENNPEEFAEVLCRELNLSGEFITAIAHAIREQTQVYTKSLFLVGHAFDGTQVDDEDIRREFCPQVTDCVRAKSHVKEFSPALFEIGESELDRQDRDRDRESRRKRRQGRAGRRGGPALPDFKELIRTFRTPVYSSILPGGVDRNDELIRKQQQAEEEEEEEEKPVVAPPVHRGRGRPAAHAAHMAIAGQNPGPKPVGRPPLHRNDSMHRQQSSFSIKSNYNSPRHSSPMHQVTTPSAPGTGEKDTYVVKLKVRNLKQILAQISKNKFVV